MGDFFSDKWDGLMGFFAIVADNPAFFAIMFIIGLPLIWWKWRTIGKSTQHAIESQTHGLRTSADSKQVVHETGIGTRDVLVMRPPPTPKGLYFALLFFGGGAVFYWLVVLQTDVVTSEDWWVFAGMTVFTLCSIAVIAANMTRIIVSDQTIEKRRLLRKRQMVTVADIVAIDPLAKEISRGAKLRTTNGQVMKIGANFSGYKDLILRLKGVKRA
ncbi:hypothetical protein L0664_11160 [Octadecabacter sp. G9-8]|uniref:PH domain-containing protein n=1 Tax=Octadecabacter dasysiphoniae TaxID=2909341 RepID=A0ABS9CWN8_9RHOB|nr:hypothetical protein [Octadecabacter dasysiphoniae]MCF2871624.1 hypothetical protein [Octadecabacter dasysiphoniae]